MLTDWTTARYLLPEITLILFAVAVFLGGTWSRTRTVWATLAVVAFGFAGLLLRQVSPDASFVWGGVTADPLGTGLRGCALVFGALFCMFATQSRQRRLFPELLGSLVLVFVGLMFVSCANDLVMLFLGLELISIPTYVLLFIGRASRNSDEATAKYFFLSILSSALMLFGFATLYGLAGDTQFNGIQATFAAGVDVPFPLLYPVAFGLILVGLCFKIAAVPFHYYAPDVYEATTNLNAALLAVVPKIAGVVGLVRVIAICLPHDSAFGFQLIIVLSMLTMTVGNVGALWQSNLRRLMAYSSIAHAGYLMIGLAAAVGALPGVEAGRDAVAAMVFYVVAYSVATIGTFACIGYLSDDDLRFSRIEELRGVGRQHPMIGGLIAICMFSLAGIPPLAGFWGKFALFRSALDVGLEGGVTNLWFIVLCVVGVLNAAVAAAYYLRVVSNLYFVPVDATDRITPVIGNAGAGLAAFLSGVIVVWVGLFAGDGLSKAQVGASSAWNDLVPTEVNSSESLPHVADEGFWAEELAIGR